MSNWITDVNLLFNAFYDLINNAAIKNTRGITSQVFKRALPGHLSKDDCPIIAVIKQDVIGGKVEKDQRELSTPRILRIEVGISDYSMVSLDDADTITDDLINKIINALEADSTLEDLSQEGIDLTAVHFDFDRREGVWFSEPALSFEVCGKNLM